jgi:PAS domain S-box-containing protein
MASESGIGKSAGNGLMENAAFLKNVLDCIQDGISILDSELNILFVNQSMEKWYAHQMPLVGRKCFEVYHGREEACEICPSLQSLKSGKPAVEVAPYTTAEGVKGWLELFTFPLKDSTTGGGAGVIEHVRDISERKRAEAAWRESEERFRKLSEASFEGIAIHERGKILAANKALADMFGYELSAVAGMSGQALVVPEHRDFLLKKEEPYEAACLKKDGTTFICKVRGKEIPYQGRQARVSAIRDITERKRAEEALRHERDYTMSIIKSTPAIVCGIAFDGTTTFVNPACESITGYNAEEIIGKNWWKLFYPGDEYRQLEPLFRDFEQGDVHDYEMALTAKDGKKRVISWSSVNRFDMNGKAVEIIGFGNDITERKQAEEALRMSMQQMADILESISDAFFVLDNQWRFTFVNSQAEKLLHRSRKELTGKNIWEEFPDAVGSMFYDRYHMAIEQNVAVSFEEYYPPLDTWYGVRAYPYREGLSVYFRDVNERKQAETKLKKFSEDLQRSNRELEEFAAVASHDLQSPLISVLSALNLMERYSLGGLGPEAEKYLTSAKDRIGNMVEVIRSMLEYSRVDTTDIKFKRTDLEAVLDRSIGNLMADISESGATVTHDPLPDVSGDAALLAQVFQNLIGNAIKFQGEEPPQVHISAERKEKEWAFSVRDNGIGIDPEDIEHIFEIFHSLKARGEYHGTGIGLATCKKIEELHGGRIWAESEPGRGSTFHFTIPDREGEQS